MFVVCSFARFELQSQSGKCDALKHRDVVCISVNLEGRISAVPRTLRPGIDAWRKLVTNEKITEGWRVEVPDFNRRIAGDITKTYHKPKCINMYIAFFSGINMKSYIFYKTKINGVGIYFYDFYVFLCAFC